MLYHMMHTDDINKIGNILIIVGIGKKHEFFKRKKSRA